MRIKYDLINFINIISLSHRKHSSSYDNIDNKYGTPLTTYLLTTPVARVVVVVEIRPITNLISSSTSSLT